MRQVQSARNLAGRGSAPQHFQSSGPLIRGEGRGGDEGSVLRLRIGGTLPDLRQFCPQSQDGALQIIGLQNRAFAFDLQIAAAPAQP
jgi:hypothetical protein